MNNQEHGLTDEQKMNIINDIEAKYQDIHLVDWADICKIMLARADVWIDNLNMKLTNPNALKLKEAADKYLAWNNKSFSGDAKMIKGGEKDHEDLISIALMIEQDEFNNRSIGNAIRKLDTFVRDYIPQNIYDRYCE